MKRVLIFSVAYHPFVGGAEVAVKEITERINHPLAPSYKQEGELQFEMITLNLDGKQLPREQVGNVLVHRIGGPGRMHKLLFPFTAWRHAVRLHKQQAFDVVWSIMASFSGFAALFFTWSFPRVPFVLTLQEGDPIPYIKRQVRLVYPLFKKIFTRAWHIQAISRYLADFAREMGATSPVTIIPNGVDLELFGAPVMHEKVEAIKALVGKQSGEILLVTTSRLVEKNGLADVINALPLLPHRVKFLILGQGPLEAELRALTKKLALGGRVVFKGQVNYADIPAYLAASDIFIRPSLSEGMGNSFIEAMAAGLPVIGTAVGGIPDFLHNYETGLVCNVNDPRDIAHKVDSLMRDPDLRARLIRNAKALAQNYDWSLIAHRLSDEIFMKKLSTV